MRITIAVTFCWSVLFCTHVASLSTDKCGDDSVMIDVGEEPGYITSPGYDKGGYPIFQMCTWELLAPADKFIKIKFLDLDFPKHSGCSDDHLQIDYEDGERYLSFCGDKLPQDVVLPATSKPNVSFDSGRYKTKHRGFKIEYSLTDKKPTCNGMVECRYPFQCLPHDSKCNGKSECYDGSDEENCGHEVVTPTECGQPAIPPVIGNDGDRIVGGRIAVKHSWPWHVSVEASNIFPSGRFCGGALINNLWVLTAAHCVSKFYDANQIRVKFGEHNLFEDDEGEVIRNVQQIIMHDEYDGDKGYNDIALLKLAAPIQFHKHISTVCLPNSEEELEIGTAFHVTGWGDTRLETGHSLILKQVMVPSTDWEKCKAHHAKDKDILPSTICIGYPEGGHNPCFGDSGGPMMALKDGRWTLYGVVSWGPAFCGNPNEPAVLTKVSAYIHWILKTVGQMS